MEVISKSPQETRKIAKQLGRNLKLGDIVALYGELGAGKTVFIQGLAEGLNIKGKITSPTFVFEKRYPVIIGNRHCIFHHLDLYRGDSIKELLSLGLEEIFSGDSIVVLEWADKIKEELPKKRIDISIEVLDEKSRRISIKRN